MKRVSKTRNQGGRRLLAVAVALAATLAFFVGGALGDAGNPIVGTITGTLVTHPDGTVTVYVRGQWNWYSHNSDCNTDRAGAGVGIIWNDPTEPGYTVTGKTPPNIAIAGAPNGATESGSTVTLTAKNAGGFSTLAVGNTITVGGVKPSGYNGTFDVTAIGSGGNTLQYTDSITGLKNGGGGNVTPPAPSGDVGISSLRPGDTVNSVDEMVHPADVGNVAEGYPGYTGQTFNDPSPDPNNYLSWKGGCGREPLTATASPGPGTAANPSGQTCADGTTNCSGHPWGSWGYEPALNDGQGQGYSHTYAKRSDVTTVCVNFYDVHGGGTGSKLQLVNGAKEITVDQNGDNSIQTNAFNVSQGANCISFPFGTPTIATTASAPVTIGGSISDTAKISGLIQPDGTGSITFTAYAPKADGSADTSCSTPVYTKKVTGINADGSYGSGSFTPSGTAPQTAGTYEWKASFSGDGNNSATTSPCGDTGEQSVVNKQSTTVATGQKIKIADYAKPSGDSPTGTVDFQLFTSADCSSGMIYDSGKVALVNGLASTNDATTQPPVLNTNGTYYWLASYSGDDSNSPAVSSCGAEQTSIAGNTPGVDP